MPNFQVCKLIVLTLAAACLNASATVSCGMQSPLPSGVPERDENTSTHRLENTERFLRRLELPELEIRLLEKRLESYPDDRASNEIVARRLVNLYTSQMSNPTVSSIHWVGKAQALLITFPSLNQPSVRVAMAQAAYIENEKRFQRWRAKGSATSEIPPLNRDWQSLASDLQRVLDDLQTEIQDQQTILQASGGRDEQAAIRLGQSESDVAQAEYLFAWTNYFIGVLNPQSRKQNHDQANRYFRQFLDIDPEMTLQKLTPKWIDFRSSYQTRALAGLAMCQRGLDHPDQSEHCFQLLDQSLLGEDDVDAFHRWKLNSQLYVNDLVGLDEVITKMLSDDRIRLRGRSKFWMEAWRGAMAIENSTPMVAKRLRDAAAAGLARDFQAQAIREILSEEVDALQRLEPNFLQNWIRGYLDFDSIPQQLPQGDYETRLALAKRQLLKSIESELAKPIGLESESSSNLTSSMRKFDQLIVQFLVAQIDLAERNLDASSEALLRISKSFEVIDGVEDSRRKELAAEAQWLAIGALTQLTQQSQSLGKGTTIAIRAVREIDHLIYRFPNCRFIRQAEFLRLKLINQNGSHDDAIARLAQIPQDHPNAIEAQLEIVRHRQERWRESIQAKHPSEPNRWAEFLDSLDVLDQLDGISDTDRLAGKVRLVSASIDRGKSDQATIADLLEQTEMAYRATVESEGMSPRLVGIASELKFDRFRVALKSQDDTRTREALTWLEQNANESKFHRAAVIEMAQLVDQEMRSLEAQLNPTESQSAERVARRTEAIKTFSQLVDLLGDSDESLKTNSNAKVAYSRLAQWKFESGDATSACEMARRLVGLFENRKDFRVLLARCFMATKSYEEAIPQWRLLSSAAQPGVDDWYEAKLSLVDCLQQTGNAESARQLLNQTRLLSPELPDRWQARFDALDQ